MKGKLNSLKISFEPVKDTTLGELFGTKPIGATDMVKKLWDFIKKQGLRKTAKMVVAE